MYLHKQKERAIMEIVIRLPVPCICGQETCDTPSERVAFAAQLVLRFPDCQLELLRESGLLYDEVQLFRDIDRITTKPLVKPSEGQGQSGETVPDS